MVTYYMLIIGMETPIIFFYDLVFKFFGSSLLVGRLAGDFLILLNVIFVFKILMRI